jgi:hypothetical protein
MYDVESGGKPLRILKPIVIDEDEWLVTVILQMPLSLRYKSLYHLHMMIPQKKISEVLILIKPESYIVLFK